MVRITPKNWKAFQHYGNRKPPWIKLHRALLDDYAFARLPIASRALAPCLWLLASEYENATITAPIEEIAFRVRMPEDDVRTGLKALIDNGFFVQENGDASIVLAERSQDASLEIEKEKEKEIYSNYRQRQQRGTRLPKDWMPEEHLDRQDELAAFRDYWVAQPGQRGVKLDWQATWRNWIRRAGEKRPSAAKTERDLRNVPDHLLSNDEYWRKRIQKETWK